MRVFFALGTFPVPPVAQGNERHQVDVEPVEAPNRPGYDAPFTDRAPIIAVGHCLAVEMPSAKQDEQASLLEPQMNTDQHR